MSSNALPFPLKLRWNYTSGTADLLSIYFSAVRLICARFRLLCDGVAQFDLFLGGSIAICSSWIHLRLVWFIFEAFDLLFGSSIDISTKCIYLHLVRFIFAWFDWVFAVFTVCERTLFYLSAINYVCTRFILFILNWLNMLAVTERQNGLEHLMHLELLLW